MKKLTIAFLMALFFALAIFAADGTIDTSFTPVGIENGTQVFSIAIQPDGKLVLVGNFATFSGVAKNAIVRLLNTISAAPVN